MVAVTFTGECRWDFFEKPIDLLISHILFPIQYQDRYVDSPQCFLRPGRRDCTANDSCQDLGISSRRSSRDETRRGEVSRNDFSLL